MFGEVGSAFLLLLALLNPFLLVIYLTSLIQEMEGTIFQRVLLRAGAIAALVFCGFAVAGDIIFSRVLQAQFASFQIFGGVVFTIIGLQFVFKGPTAIETLRGSSAHVAGAVAMPVLIGPGTLSASVVIGNRFEPWVACAIIVAAVAVSLLTLGGLKWFHDSIRSRHEALIERYIEVAGRITALYVGTVAVEMVMQGLSTWWQN